MSEQEMFIKKCNGCCNRTTLWGTSMFCNEYQELCTVLAEQDHKCTMSGRDEGKRLELQF